ncbi:DUF2285 domain-containing protein [Delftia sp. JD2]|uniref:DUF2285 domain-containing protein n=1 Tax=Delftia sp. JD2 TaxID=469553 RepID=UPI000806E7F5|nr:DUF2285 domain-containing protein [Delftia sp. JD2]OBY84511.1 hypothetical protein ACM14_15820 [Delftia sp. JD2]
MASSPPAHWHPAAAYLYALHLDGPALAWEYLRRSPRYRADWQQHLQVSAHHLAPRWGLRLFENPTRDGREAMPDWQQLVATQLHPDADPRDGAHAFDLWTFPGHRRLRLDGERLRLAVTAPGRELRVAIAPALQHGMPWTHTGRTPENLREPYAAGRALERPSAATLMEMYTLQALDGHLAGASLQELARVMFPTHGQPETWHPDTGLRSKVRRLVRRGTALMDGGYLALLQNAPAEQGRSRRASNGPARNSGHS